MECSWQVFRNFNPDLSDICIEIVLFSFTSKCKILIGFSLATTRQISAEHGPPKNLNSCDKSYIRPPGFK